MVRSLLLALLLLPSLVLAQVPNIERAGGGTGVTDHGALTGLTDDDHTQYFLLAGRSGGQTAIGGTGSGDDLTLSSSSNGTKGSIFLGSAAVSAFDETTGTLNIGATSPTMAAGIYGVATLTDTGSVQNNTARFVATIDPTSSSAAQLRAMDVYANLADGAATAVTGTVMGSRYLASNSRQTGLLSSMVGLQLQAINGIVFGAASGTATTDNITAAIFQAINNSATTTATATVTGGQFTGENRGTNTIGTVTAGQFTVTNNNASATSTALRANWLRTSTVFGSSVTAGTVTQGYMLDSEGWPSGPTYTNTPIQIRLQAGATANIAIQQQGASNQNRFQGPVIAGADTTPTSGLGLEAINVPAGITNNDNSANELRFYEPSTSGSNYSAFKAQAQTGDVTYILPAADGSANQVLKTNGSGTLSWTTVSGGGNALLDASQHTDTVAQTVSRGSIIYGNSTPKWDELTVGAANTVVRSDGTDVSWGVPVLSTAENCLGADVQMTSTGTFYDGGSVSLAAGTWLVTGTATITRTTTTKTHYTCKLWDGTTVESSSEASYDSSNPHSVSISLSGIVAPGSTTSYKISCTSTSGSTNLNLKAATPDSGSGNHATCTRAIRVG